MSSKLAPKMGLHFTDYGTAYVSWGAKVGTIFAAKVDPLDAEIAYAKISAVIHPMSCAL